MEKFILASQDTSLQLRHFEKVSLMDLFSIFDVENIMQMKFLYKTLKQVFIFLSAFSGTYLENHTHGGLNISTHIPLSFFFLFSFSFFLFFFEW